MVKFNQSLIKLYFKFGGINNEYMNLNIIYRENIIPVSTEPIQLLIEFPAKMILDISGKNMSSDTILDENGTIIKDKHIELTKVIIDNISVPDAYLKKWPTLHGNRSSYFGFNGVAELEFSEKNSFIFLLKTR